MLRIVTSNFFHVSVDLGKSVIPKKQTSEKNGVLGNRIVKPTPPSIHRYSELTVKFLGFLSKFFNILPNEKRVSKEMIDNKIVYLNKNDILKFQKFVEDNYEPQPSKELDQEQAASESLQIDNLLKNWITNWQTSTAKVKQVRETHLPTSATAQIPTDSEASVSTAAPTVNPAPNTPPSSPISAESTQPAGMANKGNPALPHTVTVYIPPLLADLPTTEKTKSGKTPEKQPLQPKKEEWSWKLTAFFLSLLAASGAIGIYAVGKASLGRSPEETALTEILIDSGAGSVTRPPTPTVVDYSSINELHLHDLSLKDTRIDPKVINLGDLEEINGDQQADKTANQTDVDPSGDSSHISLDDQEPIETNANQATVLTQSDEPVHTPDRTTEDPHSLFPGHLYRPFVKNTGSQSYVQGRASYVEIPKKLTPISIEETTAPHDSDQTPQGQADPLAASSVVNTPTPKAADNVGINLRLGEKDDSAGQQVALNPSSAQNQKPSSDPLATQLPVPENPSLPSELLASVMSVGTKGLTAIGVFFGLAVAARMRSTSKSRSQNTLPPLKGKAGNPSKTAVIKSDGVPASSSIHIVQGAVTKLDNEVTIYSTTDLFIPASFVKWLNPGHYAFVFAFSRPGDKLKSLDFPSLFEKSDHPIPKNQKVNIFLTRWGSDLQPLEVDSQVDLNTYDEGLVYTSWLQIDNKNNVTVPEKTSLESKQSWGKMAIKKSSPSFPVSPTQKQGKQSSLLQTKAADSNEGDGGPDDHKVKQNDNRTTSSSMDTLVLASQQKASPLGAPSEAQPALPSLTKEEVQDLIQGIELKPPPMAPNRLAANQVYAIPGKGIVIGSGEELPLLPSEFLDSLPPGFYLLKNFQGKHVTNGLAQGYDLFTKQGIKIPDGQLQVIPFYGSPRLLEVLYNPVVEGTTRIYKVFKLFLGHTGTKQKSNLTAEAVTLSNKLKTYDPNDWLIVAGSSVENGGPGPEDDSKLGSTHDGQSPMATLVARPQGATPQFLLESL